MEWTVHNRPRFLNKQCQMERIGWESIFSPVLTNFHTQEVAGSSPAAAAKKPLTSEEISGFSIVKENHRQCRWFQKALAMRKKYPPLVE